MGEAENDFLLGTRHGLRRQPGIRKAWPELQTQLDALYLDRVAKAPFVPKDWATNYATARDNYPDDVILLAPSRNAIGGLTTDGPMFARAPLYADQWQEIYDFVQRAYVQYAKGVASAGKAELAAAYANAAFWDGLYRVAKFAGEDLPAGFASVVAKGSGAVASTLFKGIFRSPLGALVIIGGAIGVGMYYSPAFRSKVLGVFKGAAKGAAS